MMTFHLAGTPVTFLYVSDRDRALGFYRDTLGVALRSTDEFGDFLDLGGGLVRMTVMPDRAGGPHPALGWEVADIVASVVALTAQGISFTIHEGLGQDEHGIWTSADGRSKVAFFADPDGNVLMLTQA